MTSKQRSRSFILEPIDFSHTTSYRLSIVTFALGRTVYRRLATIHSVYRRRRQTQHCSMGATGRLKKEKRYNQCYQCYGALEIYIHNTQVNAFNKTLKLSYISKVDGKLKLPHQRGSPNCDEKQTFTTHESWAPPSLATLCFSC